MRSELVAGALCRARDKSKLGNGSNRFSLIAYNSGILFRISPHLLLNFSSLTPLFFLLMPDAVNLSIESDSRKSITPNGSINTNIDLSSFCQ